MNKLYKKTGTYGVGVSSSIVNAKWVKNGVHPSIEGYLQTADAVYRNIIAEFCN